MVVVVVVVVTLELFHWRLCFNTFIKYFYYIAWPVRFANQYSTRLSSSMVSTVGRAAAILKLLIIGGILGNCIPSYGTEKVTSQTVASYKCFLDAPLDIKQMGLAVHYAI